MVGIIVGLIPSVSRYLLEIIWSVFFTEHLYDLSECGVGSYSDCLPEFDRVFSEEACEELEFLFFIVFILEKTYVVQGQAFEPIVAFFLSFEGGHFSLEQFLFFWINVVTFVVELIKCVMSGSSSTSSGCS